jgi:hypothetical protein
MYFENASSSGCLSDTLKHSLKACCAVEKTIEVGANASLTKTPCSARLSL